MATQATRKRARAQSIPQGPRYGTIQEAADYLVTNPWTIRKMIDQGKLTRYSNGAKILRVDLNEIDALMLAGGK